MPLIRPFLVVLSIAVIACQHSTAARYQRSIGFIDSDASRVISAPSEVMIGQSFDVTVSTRGDSCVSAAGAEVVIDERTASITPFDVRRDDEGCLEYSAPYPRTVRVRFPLSGGGTIRVYGRNSQNGQIVTVARSVMVRP